MPRRLKLNSSQATRLLRGVESSEVAEARGFARLVAAFPELGDRLMVALKKTRAQRLNLATACRHFLSAEALAEVLEARLAAGRGRKGDGSGAIIDEYCALVPAKVLAFPKRPAAERRRIQTAYPEVDLKVVRKALVSGNLTAEFVASVLEDQASHAAFLRDLPSGSKR